MRTLKRLLNGLTVYLVKMGVTVTKSVTLCTPGALWFSSTSKACDLKLDELTLKEKHDIKNLRKFYTLKEKY